MTAGPRNTQLRTTMFNSVTRGDTCNEQVL